MEALEADPFIAENLELDRDKTDETGNNGDDGGGSDEETGSGGQSGESVSGRYDATLTVTIIEGIVGSQTDSYPQVGQTYAGTLVLNGDCDGSGPCTASFVPGDPGSAPSVPPMEVQGSGGRLSGSEVLIQPSASCPITTTHSFDLSIEGDSVSGTYLVDPDATQMGNCSTNRLGVDISGTRTSG